ncbi:hypothetical protein GCM10027413_24380 [Conyzicola nivalis]|uniref:Tyr recombinase domain-containing protein n=2 Tax=Conyzicola nivalis TaxID=1477021 RepID=A0A916SD18_9MICO|nr:hypothetical protein GCM10010979_02240 [Conyzicola nivalis]
MVFDAMLLSWKQQQISRGMKPQSVRGNVAVVRHFREFVDKLPWEWNAGDVDEFTSDVVDRGLALSTLRHYHGAIRVFCDYITSRHYDWMEICEAQFGQIPSQVCLPWNTVAHRFDFEGRAARRPFTYDELQQLFDTADARVETLVSAGKKGGLAALRNAQMLKTAYAFGLRRTELVMLDLADLHHSSQMPEWGQYGAIHVRWGKAAGGGSPRRRTVLLVPEFDWWIDGMKQWIGEGRPKFSNGDPEAIWVTERRTRVTGGYLDKTFAELRDEAGLPKALTLHSLRHSFVTHLLEFGYAERFVQEQAGHMHASTTSIYASVSSDFKNRVLANALKRIVEGESSGD